MRKKLGVGSYSLFFFVLAIVWSSNVKYLNDFCFGDKVLNILGLPTWSKGTSGIRYTTFYSVIFLILAIIIGKKFLNDLFAKSSKVASGCLIGLILIVIIFFTPC